MEKKDDEKKDEDPRFEYMFNYLTHSRKLKIDRWAKMLAHAEYKVISTLYVLAGKTFYIITYLSISLITYLLYKRFKILSYKFFISIFISDFISFHFY